MIAHGVSKNRNNTEGTGECEVHFSEQAYLNNVIVSLVGIVAYLIAGCLINALGNKRLMSKLFNIEETINHLSSSSCVLSSNWINIMWYYGVGFVLVNHVHSDPDTVQSVCQHRQHKYNIFSWRDC